MISQPTRAVYELWETEEHDTALNEYRRRVVYAYN